MKFQVLSTDEYRQTSILGTFPTAESARKFLLDQVSDLNFSNALTTDDKFRNTEAYGIEFLDSDNNVIEDTLYSGNTTDGRPRKLVINGDKYNTEVANLETENIRVLLGNITGDKETIHYLRSPKNKEIITCLNKTTLPLVEGKTEFFIRVI